MPTKLLADKTTDGTTLTFAMKQALAAKPFAVSPVGFSQVVWDGLQVLSIFVLATGVKGLQQAYPQAQWLDPAFSGAALVLAVAVGRQRSGEERTRRRLSRKGSAADPGEPPSDGTLTGQTQHAVV